MIHLHYLMYFKIKGDVVFFWCPLNGSVNFFNPQPSEPHDACAVAITSYLLLLQRVRVRFSYNSLLHNADLHALLVNLYLWLRVIDIRGIVVPGSAAI